MNRRQDHSSLAAAAQISASIILVSISAILLATTFIAAPEALHPTDGNYEANGRRAPALPAPETVALPNTHLNPSLPVSTVILQPVTTTSINSVEGYIGFQGDFTFDETVCTFASPFVEPAGLTAAGWNVSGNILSGPGPLRTLRVSAFVNDGMTPLSGSGILYNLRMVRVSFVPSATTQLTWQPDLNSFLFIDTDLKTHTPTQANGSVIIGTAGSCTTTTFSNPGTIAIPGAGSSGIAAPYPSTISVSGMSGPITFLFVNLNGIIHGHPKDIDALLVGPQGQNAIIMSDAGGYGPVSGVSVGLTDAFSYPSFFDYVNPLPNGGPLFNGVYHPTNIADCDDAAGDAFPAPAPIPAGGSALSVFNGTDPNGTWSLYVVDDQEDNTGSFGWSVTIQTGMCPSPTPQPSPTPSPGPTHLQVDVPNNVAAGVPFQFSVTPLDRFGSSISYPGTVHFTSSDPTAVLPPDAGPPVVGGTTFAAILNQVSTRHTITATAVQHPGITGTSSCVLVQVANPSPTPCESCTPTPTPSPTPSPTASPGTPTPTPGCLPVITQSSSLTITAGTSVSCNGGSPTFFHADNSYWRAFDVSAITLGAPYNITGVEYGIETATANPAAGTQPITVRLYLQTSGIFPAGTRTQIATVTENIPNQTGTVHNVPIVATVPPGTTQLIMEVFTPDGQPPVDNSFFIGSNTAPQSGPSYISAATCGLTTPTDVSTIGFPNMHIVFNVRGACPGPTPPITPTPGIACGTFSNSTNISIPEASGTGGVAVPYPSTINVSALGGVITKVTVSINGIAHSGPADIDVLLVGPTGQNAIIMSDVGGDVAVDSVNLILDDSAANSLPKCIPPSCIGTGGLVSGTFKPTNNQECGDGNGAIDTFPAPAPSPRGGSPLSLFNGTDPNGTWSLYVVDDAASQHVGNFTNGWAITISTDNCDGPTPAPNPTPTPTAGPTHFRIQAPSFLPIPAPITFTVTAVDASNQTVDYGGTMHFTSSNPFAQLPPDSGLVNGTGTFTSSFGMIFEGHTVTATDTDNFHLTGTSNCVVLGDMTPTPPPPPTPSPSPTPLPTGTPIPTPCGVTFSENFDGVTAPSLPAGWTTAAASGISPWQTSTDNAPSGPNDAMAYESSAGGETVLETPAIAVPAEGGILSFQNHFNLLGPPGGQATNGMVLDIRINAGSYDDIIGAGGTFLDGGYTHTIGCCVGGNPLTGRMAWSGFSGNLASYITSTIRLPPAANGQSIKLKWRVGTIAFPVGGIPPSGEVRIDSIVITPANCPTPTPCPACTPTPTPTPTPAPVAHALNLSTRLRVGTGNDVGVGGFIITGGVPKQVLLRGIGPSLGPIGVADALADPVLELHGPTGFSTVTNNNWRETQEAEIILTGIAPINDLESGILMTLDPGSYTAILKGNNDGMGVGLVEIYDLSPASASKLGNLSTRAFASTGSDIVIAGFILGGGTNDDTVLLRGLGPSLIASGVSNALANPTLELRNSDGVVIAMNDDWQSGPTVSLPPSDPLESAIETTLSPGTYTALLSGVNSGTGVGLIEVYDLGAPAH